MYEIVKILLIISYFVMTNSEGITCYKCAPTREYRESGYLPCSEFDGSQKFQTECPKSTLCMKRTHIVPLGNEQIHGVERGCAPQKEEGQQYNRAERQWHRTEKVIESVYTEGCSSAEDNGRPGQPGEYCFCSYWLCNKSSFSREINFPLIALSMAVTLACAWQKY